MLSTGGPPVLSLLPCQETGERTLTCTPPPAPLLAKRRSGDAGPACPRRCLGSTSELPHSWGTGRGGTGGRVPVCVKDIFLLTAAVCTPHPVHMLSKCFSLLPQTHTTGHSGRCSSLHLAPDTRQGLCNWTHPTPWKASFQIVWSTFHSVPKERQRWRGAAVSSPHSPSCGLTVQSTSELQF